MRNLHDIKIERIKDKQRREKDATQNNMRRETKTKMCDPLRWFDQKLWSIMLENTHSNMSERQLKKEKTEEKKKMRTTMNQLKTKE